MRSRSIGRGDVNHGSNKRTFEQSKASNSFFVPFRCLISPDCAESLIGSVFSRISRESGADVAVLRLEDNPEGLEDRVVSINGSMKCKEKALYAILRLNRELNQMDSRDKRVFVCLIPESAGSLVVGSRGCVLDKICLSSACKISVGKAPIPKTTDIVVTIEGSVDGIITAVCEITDVIQDGATRGKFTRADFVVCEKFPPKEQSPMEIVDDSFDSGVPFRVLVTSREADLLTTEPLISQISEFEKNSNILLKISKIELVSGLDEILQVSGSYLGKQTAIAAIIDTFVPRERITIVCPTAMCKFLVGVKGQFVNSIMAETGAKILFPNHLAGKVFRGVTIDSSSIEITKKATNMLIHKLECSCKNHSHTDNGPQTDTPQLEDGGPVHTVTLIRTATSETCTAIAKQTQSLCEYAHGQIVISGTRKQIALAVYHLVATPDLPVRKSRDYSSDVDYSV